MIRYKQNHINCICIIQDVQTLRHQDIPTGVINTYNISFMYIICIIARFIQRHVPMKGKMIEDNFRLYFKRQLFNFSAMSKPKKQTKTN